MGALEASEQLDGRARSIHRRAAVHVMSRYRSEFRQRREREIYFGDREAPRLEFFGFGESMKKILQVRFVKFGGNADFVIHLVYKDEAFDLQPPLNISHSPQIAKDILFSVYQESVNQWIESFNSGEEANWKRLYPREYAANDIYRSPEEEDSRETSMVISIINQIQLTEANGLEVHKLTVYEV